MGEHIEREAGGANSPSEDASLGHRPRSKDAPRLAALLAQAGKGDQTAFRELYQRSSGRLYLAAIRMLFNESAAQEALQDAYFRIWNHAAGYRTELGSPMVWMTRIVRNRCIDVLRSQKRRGWSELELQDDSKEYADLASTDPEPFERLYRARLWAALPPCLESLQASQREALTLALIDGLSHTEVATSMRAPLGSVKAWIRRGVLHVREAIPAGGFVPCFIRITALA